MSSLERPADARSKTERLRQKFAQLRQATHDSMKTENAVRMRDNPTPTENELYMGAFREWIEPQVRDAAEVMFKKGYATQSSGFMGYTPELQSVDGYFTVDSATKSLLAQMGVEVLRGPEIGVPKNKLITMIRFSASEPSLSALKERWDAIAAALPPKSFPPGIHPICDRAEEFRERYAPTHPSLEQARTDYFAYLRSNSTE